MPGMSGGEVVRQLRAQGVQAPVLVITGFADSAALDTIEGGVAVLRKPFESAELLRRLADLLGV